MINGFVRVAAATPIVKVADVNANVAEILTIAEILDKNGVQIVVFPEMSVTGYTCGDLFHSSLLLSEAAKGIELIKEWTKYHNLHIIVGAPVQMDTGIANCAIFLHDGEQECV
ncbi:MAG: NAD(+) synthase, partial [Paramuribaculum sp.]|nr:NAD(+) synthase [Paramuribaculum sp.]